MTIITAGADLDPECFDEVVGSDALWHHQEGAGAAV